MTSDEPSVGDALLQARESMGLSVGDVSSLLHISDEYVLALENNQFEVMHAPTYVKGYIRNYAKLVSVDGDELVQRYSRFIQDSELAPKSAEELVSLSPDLPKRLELRWIGFGALILILVFVFVTFSTKKNNSELQRDEISLSVDKQPALSGEPQSGEPQNAENLSSSEDESKPSGNDLPSDEDSSNTSDINTQNDAPLEFEDPLSHADKTIDQPVVGTDTLFLFFNGECWVSVKDAHDFEIYAALKSAGDSLELTGVAPFRVLLGDAAVVNLNFNGKTIDLERFTRKDSGTAVVHLKPDPVVEIRY